ncbi:CAAX prenyl protease 1 [Boothiomyces macroporosus]|uniref:CAAX prenyl protease n=1 Tax=Boothiomyces macroporosus TaxID=261099 RepID=A0AAD5UJP3_9FUNG|nr:CAAX prenyl protease 1 [Boothiomyces macroporosus]
MEQIHLIQELATEQVQKLHLILESNVYGKQFLQYADLIAYQIKSYDYDSVPWKDLVVGFIVTIYLWETYLDLRQHSLLKRNIIPQALAGVITKEKFAQSNAYNIDKSRFKIMYQGIYNIAQIIVAIQYDLFPICWDYADQFLKLASLPHSEILQSIVFASILISLNTVVNLPIQLYSNFVIEERHGFNKQTYGLFFSDTIKTFFLTLIIGMPVLAGFLAVIQWAGENFFFYIWLFMVAFQIFFMIIFPTFIQPLFNKYTPLEDGELKTKIDALASKLKFPLTKVYVVDGSKRSSHSNAYFYGFFNNKRIVLFDTLLQQSTHNEVIAVLAHELGHWYHNHVFRRLLVAQAHLFVLFYFFNFIVNLQSLYTSFGFSTRPIIVGFLLFQFIYSPVETLIGFFMNVLSRRDEFQADAFAKKLGHANDLKSGLIKLQIENLSNMNPDPLYSVWHHSHPPLVQRLAAL